MIDTIKDWIKIISNIHFKGEQGDIFLFATPRGGSTWVMEILASQPKMKYFDEPFNIRRENVKRDDRFHNWEDLMPDSDNKKRIVQYINELSANKVGVMNPAPFRKHYRLLTNRVVFKVHELGYMVNTIEKECNGNILYLLRHPIPTSLSRKVFPRLELLINSEVFREKYLDQQQVEVAQKLFEKGTHLQRGMLAWCIENLVALKHSDTSKWLFLSYEELLLNPQKTCETMASYLKLPRVDLMLRALDQPSVNINMSGKNTHDILQDDNLERRRSKLVTKWKDKVSPAEEKECFEVFNLFGIDAYALDRFIASDKYLHHSDTPDRLV